MCVFMIQSLGVVVSASLLPLKIAYWVSRRVGCGCVGVYACSQRTTSVGDFLLPPY